MHFVFDFYPPSEDHTNGSWHIRASKSEETCVPTSSGCAVCKECRRMGSGHGVTRSVLKFIKKYLMARLLHARVFAGRDAALDIESAIKESPLHEHDHKNVTQLMKLPNTQLQQFVRYSWLSSTKDAITDAHADFIASIARPALR